MNIIKGSIIILIYTVIFIIYSFSLISCKRNPSNEIYNRDTIIIKVPDQIPVDLVDWEKTSSLEEVIILETTQESLITTIDKIITHSGNYYVMDWKAKSIFVFNKAGEFLSN